MPLSPRHIEYERSSTNITSKFSGLESQGPHADALALTGMESMPSTLANVVGTFAFAVTMILSGVVQPSVVQPVVAVTVMLIECPQFFWAKSLASWIALLVLGRSAAAASAAMSAACCRRRLCR